MSYKVTLLPGDGIGPEVAQAMKTCVDATGGQIAWEEEMVGELGHSRHWQFAIPTLVSVV